MSEIDAILAGLSLDRAFALAMVGVPALALGYCAGRLRSSAPSRPGTIDAAALDAAPHDADPLEETGDADLALARDSERPRLFVPESPGLDPGRSGNGDRLPERG